MTHQAGDLVVDVFRTVVGVKAQDGKWEGLQQRPDHRQEIGLGELLARGHDFPLRHAVHDVDVVDPLHPVLLALVHAVDAHKSGAPVRLRGAPAPDRKRRGPGLGPALAARPVAGGTPQVVEVRHRDPRQPRVAGVAKHRQGTLHQMSGGEPREVLVQGVGLGQKRHIGRRVFAGKALRGRAVALGNCARVQELTHQPCHLLARVARGADQVAQRQTLVLAPQPPVAKALEHRLDMRVARVLALGGQKPHLCGGVQKSLQLVQRTKSRLVHVDHHALNDRPNHFASDSYLVGYTSSRSDSYNIGQDFQNLVRCGGLERRGHATAQQVDEGGIARRYRALLAHRLLNRLPKARHVGGIAEFG